MSVRIEVRAVIACDAAGCHRTVAATGGVSAVNDRARDDGWAATYDTVQARSLHLCPRHRDPLGGRPL